MKTPWLLLALLSACAPHNSGENIGRPETPTPAEQETQISISPSDELVLRLEDPDTPPHRMFVGIYHEDTLALRMDLPSGELEEEGPVNVLAFREELTGTNLVSRRVEIVLPDRCLPDEEAKQIRIDDNDFHVTEEHDFGAGQHYVNRYYLFTFREGCVQINVTWHLHQVDSDDDSFDVANDTVVTQFLNTLNTNQ